jgi:uncharacterized membrane protein
MTFYVGYGEAVDATSRTPWDESGLGTAKWAPMPSTHEDITLTVWKQQHAGNLSFARGVVWKEKVIVGIDQQRLFSRRQAVGAEKRELKVIHWEQPLSFSAGSIAFAVEILRQRSTCAWEIYHNERQTFALGAACHDATRLWLFAKEFESDFNNTPTLPADEAIY